MISRVAQILDLYMHDERSISASELGRRTGIPKASVGRITKELIEHGFLQRSGTQIRLGIRLFELGQQASPITELRRFAYPRMSQLMRETGHTVHLAVLEGREVVYAHILRSSSTPPLPSRVGGRLPAHATAVGKALLAYAPTALVDEICKAPLEQLGPRTITDPRRLREELGVVRATKVAYEREESATNVGCAAAPVLDPHGYPVAALSVSVQLQQVDLSKLGPAVSAVALGLSQLAGRLSRGNSPFLS